MNLLIEAFIYYAIFNTKPHCDEKIIPFSYSITAMCTDSTG